MIAGQDPANVPGTTFNGICVVCVLHLRHQTRAASGRQMRELVLPILCPVSCVSLASPQKRHATLCNLLENMHCLRSSQALSSRLIQ